jgi:O-antigen ligase
VRPAARLPFYALMAFTFIAVVAPQSLFPALTPLHLALIAAGVAAASHIADRMARARPLIVIEQEVRLALLLAGLAVLSVPTSFWPAGSVDTLLQLLGKSLIVFLLVANIVVTPERFRTALWLLTACSTAPAFVVVKDYLAGNLVGARVQGYVGVLNANDVALTLNIVIPLAVGLALASRSRIERLALYAVITLAVAGVVVTFSRAGFLVLITTVFLYLARLKRGRIGIFIVVLLLVVLMLNVDGFIGRLETIGDVETESSAHARWQTMKSAFQLMLEYPLLGVGIGQNVLALNEVGAPRWSLVHNVYLQIAVDLGIPALGVYVLLLFRTLGSVRQARRAWRARDVKLHYLVQGLEIALIGFVVAAMFYPIAYHLFFFYLAGLVVAVKRLCQQDGTTAPVITSSRRSRRR